jgi:hypothetical protein
MTMSPEGLISLASLVSICYARLAERFSIGGPTFCADLISCAALLTLIDLAITDASSIE